jgi:hypothetical protein
MNESYASAVFTRPLSLDELPGSFVIITAHNPSGFDHSDEENQRFDRQLQAELHKRGLDAIAVTGSSPDFSHSEPGYAVEVDQETGVDIGRQFGQEAVFWVHDGQLHLVDCQTGKEANLGAWAERVRIM